jgi:ribokinase
MTSGVCVVGSFMMDLVVRAARRPERGETLVGTSFEMFLGGKGFNQAVAAARSGARTSIVGKVGDDEFGRRFLAALDREDIDRRAVGVDSATGTGVGMPLVEPSGDNSIIVIPRANHALTAADLRGTIDPGDVVLLQWELPHAVVAEAARIARAAHALVVLNPAPASGALDAFAGNVDYIVPNESEAAHLTGMECREENMTLMARSLRDQTGARGVIVTLGGKGATIDGREFIPAHPVACVDSVGAGDAFCGAMAAGLAAGRPLRDAVHYGNAAGALAVTKHGAEPSMPTLAEIDRLLHVA